MSEKQSDPISDLFAELNDVLDDYGFQGEVVGEATVDVTVEYGPISHDTFLRVRATAGGWALVERNEQMQRIRAEILEQHYDSDE